MSMIALSCGTAYPLPIRAFGGAAANFLTTTGNLLQIGLANISRSEERAIRNEPLKAGIILNGPLILWVFQFGKLIFDAPFDARIIPPHARWLPSINNELERLAVEVHLVDTATTLVRGLRQVTLSPALTRRFLIAVQDQLADQRSMAPYLMQTNTFPIARLPALAKVEKCGA